MDIFAIETLFQSEDTLNEVLDELKSDFQAIDKISKQLKSRNINNPLELKGGLDELTGIYMNLNPILAIAESELDNREVKYYEKLRIDIENAGGKFTSASAERQAEAFVSSYRRIRNLIRAYVEVAEKGISTFQSRLKFEASEMNMQGIE